MRRLVAAVVTSLSLPLLAEVALPRDSPGATVSLKVGTANVAISYHRPGVKGRAIWGALVPYGEVWRLGANDAATITLSHDGKIAGKDLPKGRYALFAIPTKDS